MSTSRELVRDYLTFIEDQCDVMDRAYDVLRAKRYEVELTARDWAALVWLEVSRDGKLVVSFRYDRELCRVCWSTEGSGQRNRALAEEIGDLLAAAGVPVVGIDARTVNAENR